MENLCIKMSKITKLKIHQNSMNASKPDCPMKSESSGIVTTVAHFGCQCITCCSLVNWKWCFVYCTFVSLFFCSPLLENLFRLSVACFMKETWRTGRQDERNISSNILKSIKSTSEFIAHANTSCAYTIALMAFFRGEI